MSFDFIDDDGHDVVDLTGDPDTLKRAIDSVIVAEAKFHFEDDGLSTAYVDPANVLMGDLTVPAGALESYALAEATTVGTNTDTLSSSLQPARVTKNDEIRLSVMSRQMDAYVDREYSPAASSTFHDRWKLIDPESIRQEPELPDLGDQLHAVDLTLNQLHDAVSSVGGHYEHVEFETVADGLRVRGHDDTTGSEVLIHGDIPDGIEAMYSADYLTDIADAVKSLQADDVTLKLGEDIPLKVDWGRDDGVHGTYMLAPRIPDGD